jgi:predicted esterase
MQGTDSITGPGPAPSQLRLGTSRARRGRSWRTSDRAAEPGAPAGGLGSAKPQAGCGRTPARPALAVALLLCTFFCGAFAQAPPPKRSPLLVVPNGDSKQWQAIAGQLEWRLETPPVTNIATDQGIRDFEQAVTAALHVEGVDPTRAYLVGTAAEAAATFYIASRWPEPWAAAVVLGGTPKPAIDTNRLFGVNTSLVPVLWITGKNAEAAELIGKLKAAGYNLEARESATPQEIFGWLAGHHSDAVPAEVDCETDSPTMGQCYWIQMTQFDPAERNDVLTSTRVMPGSGAMLDLGGFGYDTQAAGPGVLVTWLPEHYAGPLKLKDRIVSIGGKPLADARAYTDLMDHTTEEKPVAVMVERGKDRVRIETKIVLPKRQGAVTARVQGHYLPDLKQVQILSRAVTEMRIHLPADWMPVSINWNGSDVAKAESPGCWLLQEQKELLSAQKCRSE